MARGRPTSGGVGYVGVRYVSRTDGTTNSSLLSGDGRTVGKNQAATNGTPADHGPVETDGDEVRLADGGPVGPGGLANGEGGGVQFGNHQPDQGEEEKWETTRGVPGTIQGNISVEGPSETRGGSLGHTIPDGLNTGDDEEETNEDDESEEPARRGGSRQEVNSELTANGPPTDPGTGDQWPSLGRPVAGDDTELAVPDTGGGDVIRLAGIRACEKETGNGWCGETDTTPGDDGPATDPSVVDTERQGPQLTESPDQEVNGVQDHGTTGSRDESPGEEVECNRGGPEPRSEGVTMCDELHVNSEKVVRTTLSPIPERGEEQETDEDGRSNGGGNDDQGHGEDQATDLDPPLREAIEPRHRDEEEAEVQAMMDELRYQWEIVNETPGDTADDTEGPPEVWVSPRCTIVQTGRPDCQTFNIATPPQSESGSDEDGCFLCGAIDGADEPSDDDGSEGDADDLDPITQAEVDRRYASETGVVMVYQSADQYRDRWLDIALAYAEENEANTRRTLRMVSGKVNIKKTRDGVIATLVLRPELVEGFPDRALIRITATGKLHIAHRLKGRTWRFISEPGILGQSPVRYGAYDSEVNKSLYRALLQTETVPAWVLDPRRCRDETDQVIRRLVRDATVPPRLSMVQRELIAQVLTAEEGAVRHVVGAGGTGKTFTVAVAVVQLCRWTTALTVDRAGHLPNSRILTTAYTNEAVRNLADATEGRGCPTVIVRSRSQLRSEGAHWLPVDLECCDTAKAREYAANFGSETSATDRLVAIMDLHTNYPGPLVFAMTVETAIKVRAAATRYRPPGTEGPVRDDLFAFDHTFLDEGSTLMEPFILPVAQMSRRLTVIHDDKQNAPRTEDARAVRSWSSRAAMLDPASRWTLPVCYRNPPAIFRILSRHTYRGRVRPDPGHIAKYKADSALFWISGGSRPTGSDVNPSEVAIVKKVVQILVTEKGVNLADIVVITPYRSVLKSLEATVTCSTVDGYQGRENHVVICMLNNTPRLGLQSHIGCWRRWCVALGRAKSVLIVVGDAAAVEAAQQREVVQLPWSTLLGEIPRFGEGTWEPVVRSVEKNPNWTEPVPAKRELKSVMNRTIAREPAPYTVTADDEVALFAEPEVIGDDGAGADADGLMVGTEEAEWVSTVVYRDEIWPQALRLQTMQSSGDPGMVKTGALYLVDTTATGHEELKIMFDPLSRLDSRQSVLTTVRQPARLDWLDTLGTVDPADQYDTLRWSTVWDAADVVTRTSSQLYDLEWQRRPYRLAIAIPAAQWSQPRWYAYVQTVLRMIGSTPICRQEFSRYLVDVRGGVAAEYQRADEMLDRVLDRPRFITGPMMAENWVMMRKRDRAEPVTQSYIRQRNRELAMTWGGSATDYRSPVPLVVELETVPTTGKMDEYRSLDRDHMPWRRTQLRTDVGLVDAMRHYIGSWSPGGPQTWETVTVIEYEATDEAMREAVELQMGLQPEWTRRPRFGHMNVAWGAFRRSKAGYYKRADAPLTLVVLVNRADLTNGESLRGIVDFACERFDPVMCDQKLVMWVNPRTRQALIGEEGDTTVCAVKGDPRVGWLFCRGVWVDAVPENQAHPSPQEEVPEPQAPPGPADVEMDEDPPDEEDGDEVPVEFNVDDLGSPRKRRRTEHLLTADSDTMRELVRTIPAPFPAEQMESAAAQNRIAQAWQDRSGQFAGMPAYAATPQLHDELRLMAESARMEVRLIDGTATVPHCCTVVVEKELVATDDVVTAGVTVPKDRYLQLVVKYRVQTGLIITVNTERVEPGDEWPRAGEWTGEELIHIYTHTRCTNARDVRVYVISDREDLSTLFGVDPHPGAEVTTFDRLGQSGAGDVDDSGRTVHGGVLGTVSSGDPTVVRNDEYGWAYQKTLSEPKGEGVIPDPAVEEAARLMDGWTQERIRRLKPGEGWEQFIAAYIDDLASPFPSTGGMMLRLQQTLQRCEKSRIKLGLRKVKTGSAEAEMGSQVVADGRSRIMLKKLLTVYGFPAQINDASLLRGFLGLIKHFNTDLYGAHWTSTAAPLYQGQNLSARKFKAWMDQRYVRRALLNARLLCGNLPLSELPVEEIENGTRKAIVFLDGSAWGCSYAIGTVAIEDYATAVDQADGAGENEAVLQKVAQKVVWTHWEAHEVYGTPFAAKTKKLPSLFAEGHTIALYARRGDKQFASLPRTVITDHRMYTVEEHRLTALSRATTDAHVRLFSEIDEFCMRPGLNFIHLNAGANWVADWGSRISTPDNKLDKQLAKSGVQYLRGKFPAMNVIKIDSPGGKTFVASQHKEHFPAEQMVAAAKAYADFRQWERGDPDVHDGPEETEAMVHDRVLTVTAEWWEANKTEWEHVEVPADEERPLHEGQVSSASDEYTVSVRDLAELRTRHPVSVTDGLLVADLVPRGVERHPRRRARQRRRAARRRAEAAQEMLKGHEDGGDDELICLPAEAEGDPLPQFCGDAQKEACVLVTGLRSNGRVVPKSEKTGEATEWLMYRVHSFGDRCRAYQEVSEIFDQSTYRYEPKVMRHAITGCPRCLGSRWVHTRKKLGIGVPDRHVWESDCMFVHEAPKKIPLTFEEQVEEDRDMYRLKWQQKLPTTVIKVRVVADGHTGCVVRVADHCTLTTMIEDLVTKKGGVRPRTLLVSDTDDIGEASRSLEPMTRVVPIGEGERNEQPRVSLVQSWIRRELYPYLHASTDFRHREGRRRLDEILTQIANRITLRHTYGVRICDYVPRPLSDANRIASAAVADMAVQTMLADRQINKAAEHRLWSSCTMVCPDLRRGPATCIVRKGIRQSDPNAYVYGVTHARIGSRYVVEIGGLLHRVSTTDVMWFKGYGLLGGFSYHAAIASSATQQLNLRDLGGRWAVVFLGPPVRDEDNEVYLADEDHIQAALARLTRPTTMRASVRSVTHHRNGAGTALATIARPGTDLSDALVYEVHRHTVFQGQCSLSSLERRHYAVGQKFSRHGVDMVYWVETATIGAGGRAWAWVRTNDGQTEEIDDHLRRVRELARQACQDPLLLQCGENTCATAEATPAEPTDGIWSYHDTEDPDDHHYAVANVELAAKLAILESAVTRFAGDRGWGKRVQQVVRLHGTGMVMESGDLTRYVRYRDIPRLHATWAGILRIPGNEAEGAGGWKQTADAITDAPRDATGDDADWKGDTQVTTSVECHGSLAEAIGQTRQAVLGLALRSTTVLTRLGYRTEDQPEAADDFLACTREVTETVDALGCELNVGGVTANPESEDVDNNLTPGLDDAPRAGCFGPEEEVPASYWESMAAEEQVYLATEIHDVDTEEFAQVDADRAPPLFDLPDCGKTLMNSGDDEMMLDGDCTFDSVMAVMAAAGQAKVVRVLLDGGCSAGGQVEPRKYRPAAAGGAVGTAGDDVKGRRRIYISRSHYTHTNVSPATARLMEAMGVKFETMPKPISIGGFTGGHTDLSPRCARVRLGFLDHSTGQLVMSYPLRVYLNPALSPKYQVILGVIDLNYLKYRPGGVDVPWVWIGRHRISHWTYSPNLDQLAVNGLHQRPVIHDQPTTDDASTPSGGEATAQNHGHDTVMMAHATESEEGAAPRWYDLALPLPPGSLVAVACLDTRLQPADADGAWAIPILTVPPSQRVRFTLVPKGPTVKSYPRKPVFRVTPLEGSAPSIDQDARAMETVDALVRLSEGERNDGGVPVTEGRGDADGKMDGAPPSDPIQQDHVCLAKYKQRAVVSDIMDEANFEERVRQEELEFYQDGIPVDSEEWVQKVFERVSDMPEKVMDALVIDTRKALGRPDLSEAEVRRFLDLYFETVAVRYRGRYHQDGQGIEVAAEVGLDIVDLDRYPSDVPNSANEADGNPRVRRLLAMLIHREVHLGHLEYVDNRLVLLVAKVLHAARKGKASGRPVYSMLLYNAMNKDIPACDALIASTQRLLRGSRNTIGFLENDVCRCYNHVAILAELQKYLGVKAASLLCVAKRAALGMRNIPSIWSHVVAALNALVSTSAAEQQFLVELFDVFEKHPEFVPRRMGCWDRAYGGGRSVTPEQATEEKEGATGDGVIPEQATGEKEGATGGIGPQEQATEEK